MLQRKGVVIMNGKLGRLLRDERGVTALEYSLIAGLILVLLIVSLNVMGPSLDQVFVEVADHL
jgi:pilus assembly protein Flp/PilA